jgi:macrolide transport system ATP-binding/permease protein
MGRLRIIWNRCTGFFGAKKLDDELDEELLTHIGLAVEENLRSGMSQRDARRAALLTFGGLAQVKEMYRRQRGLPLLEAFAQDIRYGTRQLKRAPGFASIAILTLALGIGANTAVFTLTHAALTPSVVLPLDSRSRPSAPGLGRQ